MRVSTIIPVINEQALIAHAIQNAWDSGADEVIVVDGGSRDETARIAGQSACRLLAAQAGRAYQQNAGAEVSIGDVLCFMHADNRLAIGALQQVRDALQDESKSFGAFRQRIEAPGPKYRAIELGNACRVRLAGCPYGDQGIFVRRATFWEHGGFPETPILEDVLLSRALRRKTWPVLLPGPLYVHARRWQRFGVVRQTLRNWKILAAYRLGIPAEKIASWYRRHDE